MLNPFPIQYLALLGYLILRLTIAGVLLYLAYYHYSNRHVLWYPPKYVPKFIQSVFGWIMPTVFPICEAFIAIFLTIGAWTQYAALATMIMSLKLIIFRHWFSKEAFPSRLFFVLLLGAATTLFITGAGALAFDLPI